MLAKLRIFLHQLRHLFDPCAQVNDIHWLKIGQGTILGRLPPVMTYDLSMEPDWLRLQYPRSFDGVNLKKVPLRACQECRRFVYLILGTFTS